MKEREALKALVHEMEYVLSCINAEEIPFDGDDFHEALRLGKEALDHLAQPEQEPLATPLPCDVKVGHVTIRKGVALSVLIARMQVLYDMAQSAMAQPEQEPKCNPHPKAPHGFNRNASHANDRYTCECESWDAYEAGRLAGIEQEQAMYEVQRLGQEIQPEPPQRTWVGLTDEEQQELYDAWVQINDGWGSFYALIEAKLKEKNQ